LRTSGALTLVNQIRPLRIAASQSVDSEPRTIEKTSSSCCSRHGHRPAPSPTQSSQCPPYPAQSIGSKSRIVDVTNISRCSRYTIHVGLDLCRAKTVTPLRPTLEQDTGNNATHHRSDVQLVLFSSCASSYVRPKQSSPWWPTAHISLARLPIDASLLSPRHLSLTPSALLCSLACEVPIEGKRP
jgi:hypothetical protein